MRFNPSKVEGYCKLDLQAQLDADAPPGLACYEDPSSWVPLWLQRLWLRVRRWRGNL